MIHPTLVWLFLFGSVPGFPLLSSGLVELEVGTAEEEGGEEVEGFGGRGGWDGEAGGFLANKGVGAGVEGGSDEGGFEQVEGLGEIGDRVGGSGQGCGGALGQGGILACAGGGWGGGWLRHEAECEQPG